MPHLCVGYRSGHPTAQSLKTILLASCFSYSQSQTKDANYRPYFGALDGLFLFKGAAPDLSALRLLAPKPSNPGFLLFLFFLGFLSFD